MITRQPLHLQSMDHKWALCPLSCTLLGVPLAVECCPLHKVAGVRTPSPSLTCSGRRTGRWRSRALSKRLNHRSASCACFTVDIFLPWVPSINCACLEGSSRELQGFKWAAQMGRVEKGYEHPAAQDVLPPLGPAWLLLCIFPLVFPNFLFNFADVNEFLMPEVAADVLSSKKSCCRLISLPWLRQSSPDLKKAGKTNTCWLFTRHSLVMSKGKSLAVEVNSQDMSGWKSSKHLLQGLTCSRIWIVGMLEC